MVRDDAPRTFYPISFRLDGGERYFLWYTMEVSMADPDRVLLDRRGHLIVFESLESLGAYVADEGFTIGDTSSIAHYDFDLIEQWLRSPDPDMVNCNTFLGVWNILDDLSLSLRLPKLFMDGGRDLDGDVYTKMFAGNNLPAIKPGEAPDFEPIWSNDEIKIMIAAFDQGLSRLRSVLG